MKVKIKKPILRILRGKSNYPLRALDVDRFLIGAGSSCQLQLSAGEVPMVFAVMSPAEEGHRIESMYPYPELIVNGASVRESILLPGDQFQVGPYTFEYLLGEFEHEFRTTDQTEEESSQADSNKTFSVVPAEVPQAEVASLSASELIDRLQQELELLEEMDYFDDLDDQSDLPSPGQDRLSA